MGINKKRFISEISTHHLCPYCNEVLENPRELNCDHTFCMSCIEKQKLSNGMCITCGTTIETMAVRDKPIGLEQQIKRLKITCDFKEYGCEEIIEWNLLELHRLECVFHPDRKRKCDKCQLLVDKENFETHNCFISMRSMISVQAKYMNEVKLNHEREVALLKTKCWSACEESNREDDGVVKKVAVQFVCTESEKYGQIEIIIIHSQRATFKCEAHSFTKVGLIKYQAAKFLQHNTDDVSLFFMGKILDDKLSIGDCGVRNNSQLHLMPNELYIKFDCPDIHMIIGMAVKTCDTVSVVMDHLLDEIRRRKPDQVYFFYLKAKKGSYCLLFNETKLEETYPILNYDVYSMKTLTFTTQSNR